MTREQIVGISAVRIKCPRCGYGNRNGVRFCEECGGKLERVCPSCGTAIPLGKKFCGECGQPIVDTGATLSVDLSSPRSYTPTYLADKILSARDTCEGERKLVTVLFADVANFTSLSEKLDPEEVRRIMDGCFEILIREVHRYEGFIDKFTGMEQWLFSGHRFRMRTMLRELAMLP